MTTPPTRRAPRKAAAKPATRRTSTVKAAPKKAAEASAKPVVSPMTAWSIGAVVVAAGAGLAAFFKRGRIVALLARDEEHVPTDLMDTDGSSVAKEGEDRAIPAFRPDMDAPMTAAERAALAPATGSSN